MFKSLWFRIPAVIWVSLFWFVALCYLSATLVSFLGVIGFFLALGLVLSSVTLWLWAFPRVLNTNWDTILEQIFSPF